MRKLKIVLFSFALSMTLGANDASAEPVVLDAILSITDDISLAFKDDKHHFVTLLKREGQAAGKGVFKDAKVIEYGMHDVTLGESANARGYIEVTTIEGDIAYLRWQLSATFVAGADGKAKLINAGSWELTGGTGQFEAMRGVGTMFIEFPSKTERRYVFEGDISPAP